MKFQSVCSLRGAGEVNVFKKKKQVAPNFSLAKFFLAREDVDFNMEDASFVLKDLSIDFKSIKFVLKSVQFSLKIVHFNLRQHNFFLNCTQGCARTPTKS